MKIERQLQGTLNTVFTEIIRERGLENKIQPFTTIEENRADITLKKKSGNPIFFIELKDPTAKNGRSVFDSETVLRELSRAQKYDIRYFGTCNFLACAFFDGNNIKDKVSVSEGFFSIQEITRLSNNYVVSNDIEKKLRSIAEFYIARALEIIERKAVTFAQPDELYIFKIRKLIEAYSHSVSDKVWDKYRSNKKFEKEIQIYTTSQLWNNPKTFEEIENLTHIALLMLISKLIFYKAYVDNQTWHNLSPMKVGKEIETAVNLENLIWEYFTEFKDVTGDFELLIGERSDIIFQIPFVSDTVVELVVDILETDRFYDFSKIPYDIIGRIFEELIREDERHKLGQYFTPPHVIDLINAFAIHSENDKVFDPSCGSGTFLVRAYERKKLLSQSERGATKRHEILLSEIYGNDLSGYPAYLSMLNLSIRNTRRKSYPRIINKDFFSIMSYSKIELHNNDGEIEKKILPQFNAIIGNPPYTRQEDIGAMHGTVKKEAIQTLVKAECGFNPSQRTSIYAYFFYHAATFLKDNGYLGYIVQNSWLDTDYGSDLQQYFHRNFEILAIMDSEVERFFPTASVNTSIVVLRKQKTEEIRTNNVVKFVYFKDTLLRALKFYGSADKLKSFIEGTNSNTINEYLKINCVNQSVLAESKKWGQFLKAPKVYFDILEKGKGKFQTLDKLADVKFGIKTGCNEFFIIKEVTDELKDEEIKAIVNNINDLKTIKEVKSKKLKVVCNGFNEYWLIEKQFVIKCIKSPKDINSNSVSKDDLLSSLFYIDIDKQSLNKYPYSFHYIKYGESKSIHTRPTCASRNEWWNLVKDRTPDLLWPEMYFDRYFVAENKAKFLDTDKFYGIYFFDRDLVNYYATILNSTFYQLYREFISFSSLGEGITKTAVYDVKLIPVIKNQPFLKEITTFWKSYSLNKTLSLNEIINPVKSISLKNIEPERLKLDKLFLKTIGFKNNEIEDVLLRLYTDTKNTIDARLQKAQSLKGVKVQRNKTEFSVYLEQLKHLVEEESLKPKNNLIFAKQIQKLVTQITSEISLQKKILTSYWKELYNEVFDEKIIANKAQTKLF
ncbi:MAG: N-6 DNA methylase [Bacteroidales bacterium]